MNVQNLFTHLLMGLGSESKEILQFKGFQHNFDRQCLELINIWRKAKKKIEAYIYLLQKHY